MKVRELLEILQDVDPEREVILQGDSEGNYYKTVAGADDNCLYYEENKWSGEVGPEDYADAIEHWGEGDVPPGGTKALVIYPVN